MTIEEAISKFNELLCVPDEMILRHDLNGEQREKLIELKQAQVMAIKALEERQKYRWIPVTERLPEKEGYSEYLCQTKYGSLMICGFTKDAYKLEKYDFEEYKGKKKKLFYKYDSEYECGYYEVGVVAWMPLPEPYEEVEE